MPYLLQVDFPYAGPWGDEMGRVMEGLARSIAVENGLIWKIWTEDVDNGRAGGVYLFEERDSTEAYLKMHTRRLQDFGCTPIQAQISAINAPLSTINRGPISH